ncbi:MAG: hypothetical protein ACKOBH_07235 [bacterium]
MASTNQIEQLIGVYDANGSILGEISYWVGARLGRRHCALCEITHGVFKEKAEWRSCSSNLPVPFQALHLDELPPAVSSLVGSEAPCVVAERSDGDYEIVIDRHQLESCDGQPARLAELIEALT